MTQSVNVNPADNEFLLGLVARYPEVRGVLRVADLPAPVFNSLRGLVTDEMLEQMSTFSADEVADAESRIFERFAPVSQYGI